MRNPLTWLFLPLAVLLTACGGGGRPENSPFQATIQGSVNYEGYGHPNLAWGFVFELDKPVRGAVVKVMTTSGIVIDSTNTNVGGKYSLRGREGDFYEMHVLAALGDRVEPHVRVVGNIVDSMRSKEGFLTTEPFTITSEKFQVLDATTNFNFELQSGWEERSGIIPPDSERESGPFAILDTIFQAQRLVQQVDTDYLGKGFFGARGGVLPLPTGFETLLVEWRPEQHVDHDFTWSRTFQEDGAPHEMILSGDWGNDMDEFDQSVIASLWAYYYETTIGRRLDGVFWKHFDSRQDDRTNYYTPLLINDEHMAWHWGFRQALGAMIVGSQAWHDTNWYFGRFEESHYNFTYTAVTRAVDGIVFGSVCMIDTYARFMEELNYGPGSGFAGIYDAVPGIYYDPDDTTTWTLPQFGFLEGDTRTTRAYLPPRGSSPFYLGWAGSPGDTSYGGDAWYLNSFNIAGTLARVVGDPYYGWRLFDGPWSIESVSELLWDLNDDFNVEDGEGFGPLSSFAYGQRGGELLPMDNVSLSFGVLHRVFRSNAWQNHDGFPNIFTFLTMLKDRLRQEAVNAGLPGANDATIVDIENMAWVQNIPRQHDAYDFNRGSTNKQVSGPVPLGPNEIANEYIFDADNLGLYHDKEEDAIPHSDMRYHTLPFGRTLGILPAVTAFGEELSLSGNANSNGRSIRIREFYNNDHPDYQDEYGRLGNQWYFAADLAGRPPIQDAVVHIEISQKNGFTQVYYREPNTLPIVVRPSQFEGEGFVGPITGIADIPIPVTKLNASGKLIFAVGTYTDPTNRIIADSIQFNTPEQANRNTNHFSVQLTTSQTTNN